MPDKIRILYSDKTNPWFNLATEDWIFHDLAPDVPTLFLWRNDNTVVIGRYQNPWAECDVAKMEADGIILARRQSGGGAVFHDLGNTNFTFLSSSEIYQQDVNFKIIQEALGSLGIVAERSGRNDLTVGGKKVSGSAFRQTKRNCFHHGTLLVNANMQRLGDYLTPSKLKLVAKGIKSVKSRVVNLAELNPSIDHEEICHAIIQSFCRHYGLTTEVEHVDEEQLSQIDSLQAYYQKMADWDWRFGKTPQFSHTLETRLEWGVLQLHLDVVHAVVDKARVFSDALDTDFIGLLEQGVPGMSYSQSGIIVTFEALKKQYPSYSSLLEDVEAWLKKTISTMDK